MVNRYIVTSLTCALGVLSTVAFYEGKEALGKNRHPSSISKEPKKAPAEAAGAAGIEDARQQLADSLIRCQDELTRTLHGGASDEQPTAELSLTSEPLTGQPAQPQPPVEDRFDPSPDEWQRLAQRGQVKLSRPCIMGDDWEPVEGDLQSVGLGSRDAQTVAEAFRAANARAWESTRASCAEWLGADARVAERIGAETCESLLDQHAQEDEGIFRHVAEVRAGSRNEGTTQGHPLERYYLAKTRELKDFEADLTRRVGADAARRITSSTTFCMNREEWPPTDRE
ncbi:hypothetical protein LZC95_21715 [Pendulispora brunnea]|uniref:Uncharacterized protein n=1 Tax=Pendulispora brunnea TaxID=2905690 RepID=A0ABZ2KQV7_9BACT